MRLPTKVRVQEKTRERKIQALVKKFTQLIGLERWDIKVQFCEMNDAKATCEADPEYFKATIKFDLTSFPEDEDRDYVVHELLHCLVWVLSGPADALAKTLPEPGDKFGKEVIREAEERLTSLLEQMPVWSELETDEE